MIIDLEVEGGMGHDADVDANFQSVSLTEPSRKRIRNLYSVVPFNIGAIKVGTPTPAYDVILTQDEGQLSFFVPFTSKHTNTS